VTLTKNLIATRSIQLLVATLLLAAFAGYGTGIAMADWDVDDRLWANNCNGAEKDPVNIMFRGDGELDEVLDEWDHHLSDWDEVKSDSTLYFKVHGTCTAQEAKRMEPMGWWTRDHVRFVEGDYDSTEEDWTAAAAHHDTCLPHAGVEFDDKRDKARTGFINGGHYTELRSTFSSGSVYVICFTSGWYESWDGDVAWISIPGTAH